jgi:hypothetical protein
MGILDAFDADLDELALLDEALTQPPRRNDKRICICGHPMSRHNTKKAGECVPARFTCACRKQVPVLEVPDTRYFLSRSLGSGEKHALMRGIFLAQKGMGEAFDEKAKWLVDLECWNPACKAPTKLFPVRTDPDLYRIYDSNKDEGVSAFLCEKCRELYTDSEESIEIKRQAIRAVPDNK